MKENVRLLAGILFTDIVGYSGMMENDEKKTYALREKHRNILENLVELHEGKLLQYYGDGTLTIFSSAINCVICAVKIQQEFLKNEIPVRIGIHLGDIMYNHEGVYGDSINVASRIESLSVAGSVLISEKVYDEIKNQKELSVKSLGMFDLKNIKKPIEVFALTNENLVVPDSKDIEGKTKDPGLSIAVLPFLNMSNDADNEYFSDGITEELINALVKVEGLQVISGTTSMMLKGKINDLQEIRDKLKVTYVIQGSVSKSENMIRINTKLIYVLDGTQLWSESFDRELKDIFKIQAEISKNIVDKLRDKLAIGRVVGSLIQSRDTNIDAYNHYLMGLFYWKKWTEENIDNAIICFEKSIKVDPNFALAYAYLSICYIFYGYMGIKKPKIAYSRAKLYAEKAIELDNNLAESHIALAMSKLLYDWNFEEANSSFLKALDISPGLSLVRYAYSIYLLIVGRTEDSLCEIEIAMKLDPLSWQVNDQLGIIYNYSGRYDDAILQFEKTLDMSPLFRNTLENLGLAYAFNNEHQKAIETLTQIQIQTNDKTSAAAALGYAYAIAGMREEAYEYLNIIKKNEQKEKDNYFSYDYALIYSGLKQYDKMFEYLESSVKERLTSALFLASHPVWRSYSKDQRYQNLLKNIGLNCHSIDGTVNCELI